LTSIDFNVGADAARARTRRRLRAWAGAAAEAALLAIAIAGGAAYYAGSWAMWSALLEIVGR
jgi:hypothetical protein